MIKISYMGVVLYIKTPRTTEAYRVESICKTFKTLRANARRYVRNKHCSEAVNRLEKAFEFGLKNKHYLDNKAIGRTALHILQYASSLPKNDPNYCKPIWVAIRFLKYFNNDDDEIFQSTLMAYFVIDHYKPVAHELPPDDLAALDLLEHEKNQYRNPLRKD